MAVSNLDRMANYVSNPAPAANAAIEAARGSAFESADVRRARSDVVVARMLLNDALANGGSNDVHVAANRLALRGMILDHLVGGVA